MYVSECEIGIKTEDGVLAVNCLRPNGYPNAAGEMLRKHYTTTKQVKELITKGNIDTLAPVVADVVYKGFPLTEENKYKSFSDVADRSVWSDWLYYWDENKWVAVDLEILEAMTMDEALESQAEQEEDAELEEAIYIPL